MATTEKVLAGEVCSIDIAKKYGFYDPQTYYTTDYSDTMTYGGIDTEDRIAKVCKQSTDGTVSYPLCPVVYGVPYEQDKINPNKCIINECPPEFKKDKDKCIKPTDQEATSIPIGKKTHCDEKTTDWYMIPNYHLGNKYNFISDGSNVSCMKPCPPEKVPGYTEDPVDGSSAGVLTNTELNQCYNKNEYMGGKYINTGNFCPISWVYRLGQTKEDIMNDMTSQILEMEKNNGTNMYLNKAKEIANTEAQNVYTESKKLLENVDTPSTVMLSACTKLHTPDRVKKAYQICKNIYDDPKSINNIVKDKTQQKVLRQSCHALFCNPEDDLVSTISPGTQALCFKDIGNVNSKALLQNDRSIENSQSSDINHEPAPSITKPNNVNTGINYTKRAAYTGLFIVIGIPILIISIYIIYKIARWLWYHIIKPYIWCYTRYVLELAALHGPGVARNSLKECQIQMKAQAAAAYVPN